MIDTVLLFLKNELNEYLGRQADGLSPDGKEDAVVFLDGEKMDPVSFRLGAVTTLLINVEEEHLMRSADPYARIAADGSVYGVRPDIRLNLFVLFVAHYKVYDQALAQISRIVQFFQSHRVFERQRAPTLPDAVERLIVELMTLPFSEQNDIWNALRTTYHPSLLYRIRMLVYEDREAQRSVAVKEKTLDVVHAGGDGA